MGGSAIAEHRGQIVRVIQLERVLPVEGEQRVVSHPRVAVDAVEVAAVVAGAERARPGPVGAEFQVLRKPARQRSLQRVVVRGAAELVDRDIAVALECAQIHRIQRVGAG